MERDRSSSVGSPSTAITTPESRYADHDDIWESDHENNSGLGSGNIQREAEMLSDLPTVKRQHMTDGYREGLSIGKAKVMQKGFDEGYPIGMAIALRAGKVLGVMEGIIAAKDIPDTSKTSVRKLFNQAKKELAVAALLKEMTDQTISQATEVPDSIEQILCKWEARTFSPVSGGESE